ncbi:hypothetical protein POX_b02543 [Penicillium oxalicum]|uniref:hypothetical protein n=1 Tax=Penicillium oxalicum TaxID=69781 RepID=UPI0020B6380F|nr:hypothetical protein POX_b02543 [Penicillium oxalicum]KAI2792505.1 hypothetical protein POX_b02543 [Penicillium oxalicum]
MGIPYATISMGNLGFTLEPLTTFLTAIVDENQGRSLKRQQLTVLSRLRPEAPALVPASSSVLSRAAPSVTPDVDGQLLKGPELCTSPIGGASVNSKQSSSTANTVYYSPPSVSPTLALLQHSLPFTPHLASTLISSPSHSREASFVTAVPIPSPEPPERCFLAKASIFPTPEHHLLDIPSVAATHILCSECHSSQPKMTAHEPSLSNQKEIVPPPVYACDSTRPADLHDLTFVPNVQQIPTANTMSQQSGYGYPLPSAPPSPAQHGSHPMRTTGQQAYGTQYEPDGPPQLPYRQGPQYVYLPSGPLLGPSNAPHGFWMSAMEERAACEPTFQMPPPGLFPRPRLIQPHWTESAPDMHHGVPAAVQSVSPSFQSSDDDPFYCVPDSFVAPPGHEALGPTLSIPRDQVHPAQIPEQVPVSEQSGDNSALRSRPMMTPAESGRTWASTSKRLPPGLAQHWPPSQSAKMWGTGQFQSTPTKMAALNPMYHRPSGQEAFQKELQQGQMSPVSQHGVHSFEQNIDHAQQAVPIFPQQRRVVTEDMVPKKYRRDQVVLWDHTAKDASNSQSQRAGGNFKLRYEAVPYPECLSCKPASLVPSPFHPPKQHSEDFARHKRNRSSISAGHDQPLLRFESESHEKMPSKGKKKMGTVELVRLAHGESSKQPSIDQVKIGDETNADMNGHHKTTNNSSAQQLVRLFAQTFENLASYDKGYSNFQEVPLDPSVYDVLGMSDPKGDWRVQPRSISSAPRGNNTEPSSQLVLYQEKNAGLSDQPVPYRKSNTGPGHQPGPRHSWLDNPDVDPFITSFDTCPVRYPRWPGVQSPPLPRERTQNAEYLRQNPVSLFGRDSMIEVAPSTSVQLFSRSVHFADEPAIVLFTPATVASNSDPTISRIQELNAIFEEVESEFHERHMIGITRHTKHRHKRP